MLLALAASLALQFNIPSGPAATTLRVFASQSNFNMLFQSNEVTTQLTHPVSGRLDPRKALQRMTQGTGLGFHVVDGDSVLVYVLDAAPQKTKTEPEKTKTEPAECECIILGGFVTTPYCNDGSPKPQVKEGCRIGP